MMESMVVDKVVDKEDFMDKEEKIKRNIMLYLTKDKTAKLNRAINILKMYARAQNKSFSEVLLSVIYEKSLEVKDELKESVDRFTEE